MLWKRKTYSARSLVIDKNGVIYGLGDYHVYALNPNGTLRWMWKTNEYLIRGPSIGKDGTIYFVGESNLYAIEPRDAADLRITGVYYGPTFRCIKIRVKNVGCEPAYNATCKAIVHVTRRFAYDGGETKVFETTVPFIDVGEEKVVKIGPIYLPILLYRSPLIDLYDDCSLEMIYVDGENINPDIYLEGGKYTLITIWGPFVFMGTFLVWLALGSRWVEITS